MIMNIENNLISDLIFMSNEEKWIFKTLRVVNIANNKFTQIKTTFFLSIYKKNPCLYFYNDWEYVDDDFAIT